MRFTNDVDKAVMLVNRIIENDGYCPCAIQKNEDTICPCKKHREEAQCICGLFIESK